MKEEVLEILQRHLNSPLKPSGNNNYSAKCPFHKDGNERRPSFGINIEKGVFHCFTCHIAGDLKRLLRLLGLPREVIDYELRNIQEEIDRNRELHRIQKEHLFERVDPFKAQTVLPEALLGLYDWCPINLLQAGFKMELLQEMEVGYDRNNLRVTYAIRDLYGNLAGISGGATLPDQRPKYKVYKGSSIDAAGRLIPGDFGSWFDQQFQGFQCKNHEFLWNYDKVYPIVLAMSDPSVRVYIVEGFKACLWMIQNGYRFTVALMGSGISETQQQMLHRIDANIILCLDNDEAGIKGTMKIGNVLLGPMKGKVGVINYPITDHCTQPDDYKSDQLASMLQTPTPFLKYKSEAIKRNQL